MIYAQSNFLRSIGNCAKSWDVTGSNRGRVAAEAGYRRDGAREGRKGANIKEEARRGRGTPWTTRERFRTGWKPTAHAVFLRGVPYLIRLPEDRPEPARPVRGPFALARVPRHPIIGPQLHFCARSILGCTRTETLSSCLWILPSFVTCEALKFQAAIEWKIRRRDRLFFSQKKRRRKMVLPVPVLLYRAVIKIVRK